MAKEEKNSGAILYFEYAETFELLSREDRGDLVTAMLEYGMTGEVATELSDCAKIAFSSIKRQMDRDADKYRKKCEKNAENGTKGGRPKKETSEEEEKANGFLENPKKPNGFSEKPKKANKKEKEKENENIKENINTHSVPECVDAHACENTHAEAKKGYGIYENVMLTEAEYEDIMKRCPGYLDKFSQGIKSGWKYASHYEMCLKHAKDRGYLDNPQKNIKPSFGNFDTDDAFEKAVAKTMRQREKKRDENDIQNTG